MALTNFFQRQSAHFQDPFWKDISSRNRPKDKDASALKKLLFQVYIIYIYTIKKFTYCILSKVAQMARAMGALLNVYKVQIFFSLKVVAEKQKKEIEIKKQEEEKCPICNASNMLNSLVDLKRRIHRKRKLLIQTNSRT